MIPQLPRQARLMFNLTLAGAFAGLGFSNLNTEVALLDASGAPIQTWDDKAQLLQGGRTSASLPGTVSGFMARLCGAGHAGCLHWWC